MGDDLACWDVRVARNFEDATFTVILGLWHPTTAVATTVLPIPPCGPKLLRAARLALYAPYRAARMENGPHGWRTGHTDTETRATRRRKW